MTDFSHSIVLFSGDDGLPLEFNVRNTKEKLLLKAMIEHGGGLCTQSDNAVHLMSPGTKVLNADLGKKLVSSRYIFDCVDKNYLLEVDKYVFTISEAQTSDISDEDSERKIDENPPGLLNAMEAILDSSLDLDTSSIHEKLDCNSSSNSTTSKLSNIQQKSTTVSNLSESFVEGSQDVSHNPRIAAGTDIHTVECVPLTSTAKEQDSMDLLDNYDQLEKDLSPIRGSASLVSPQKRTRESPKNKQIKSPQQLVLNDDSSVEIESYPSEGLPKIASPKKSCTFPHYERKDDSEDELQIIQNISEFPVDASPIHTAVTSSQPGIGLDQFDNLLLNKAQQKAQSDDEDGLSQSYTVSSSADAQKPSSSAEMNSADMLGAGPTSQIPDSPTQGDGHITQQDQTSELQSYIQELEAEVKRILQKPSPKSIQDKICLVKYLCCVKKLSPACVLQSLHQL